MTRLSQDNIRAVGGRYEVLKPLAEGGMGALYVARHLLTRQEVALKILDPRFVRDPAGVERFLREVSVAARIGHEGVVKVFDAGVDDGPGGTGSLYLAMELLDGETLAQRLARGDVSVAQTLAWFRDLLVPLEAAHDVGVVHRDLKPENIFLARGPRGEVVKILDFGIARETGGSSSATMEGTALGTVYYMSPEQGLNARSATQRSDVWSLGAMLYQCVSGYFPFDGDSPAAVLLKVHNQAFTPLSVMAPWCPAPLAALIERCLSKAPEDRPADARALRAACEAVLGDPSVVAALAGRTVDPSTFQAMLTPSEHFDDPFAGLSSPGVRRLSAVHLGALIQTAFSPPPLPGSANGSVRPSWGPSALPSGPPPLEPVAGPSQSPPQVASLTASAPVAAPPASARRWLPMALGLALVALVAAGVLAFGPTAPPPPAAAPPEPAAPVAPPTSPTPQPPPATPPETPVAAAPEPPPPAAVAAPEDTAAPEAPSRVSGPRRGTSGRTPRGSSDVGARRLPPGPEAVAAPAPAPAPVAAPAPAPAPVAAPAPAPAPAPVAAPAPAPAPAPVAAPAPRPAPVAPAAPPARPTPPPFLTF